MYWIFQLAGAAVAAIVAVYVFKQEGTADCAIAADGKMKAIAEV